MKKVETKVIRIEVYHLIRRLIHSKLGKILSFHSFYSKLLSLFEEIWG